MPMLKLCGRAALNKLNCQYVVHCKNVCCNKLLIFCISFFLANGYKIRFLLSLLPCYLITISGVFRKYSSYII